MKQSIRAWLPPALISFFRQWKKSDVYTGNYASWQEALDHATGYDSNLILEKVSSALAKVKAGEAAYERDSVLFENIEYPFPVLAVLLRAASENNGRLNVLDFGGSLGSTYFQCREFLSAIPHLTWHVVEQEMFVKRGKELFETEQLKFFFSIKDSIDDMQPDVVLFSSVLQYIKNPFEILRTAMESVSQYILIDRTPFSALNKDRLCVQHVPVQIYSASYPCWIFSESNFKQQMLEQFELIACFKGADGSGQADKLAFDFKGMFWKRQ